MKLLKASGPNSEGHGPFLSAFPGGNFAITQNLMTELGRVDKLLHP